MKKLIALLLAMVMVFGLVACGSPAANESKAPADPSKAGTNNFMKYFFPLFSLWICSSYNALFSLYWVVSNIFAWIQSVAMNKYFDNMDKKEKLAKEGNVK